MENEKLHFNIPADSNLTIRDFDNRAEDLGLKNKSELMRKGVDMMMNFDLDFYKKIQSYATGLNVPEYMVIQNMIINLLAQREAKAKVWGSNSDILLEFISVANSETGDYKMLTGNDLKKHLLEYYIRQEQKEYDRVISEQKQFDPGIKPEPCGIPHRTRSGKDYFNLVFRLPNVGLYIMATEPLAVQVFSLCCPCQESFNNWFIHSGSCSDQKQGQCLPPIC
jgi:hypothetical protein